MSITFAPECDYCVTDDGHGFHFYDVGTGPTPVVFLHGLFGSPSNWLPIMHSLADHYRFLALQLPIDFHSDRRHPTIKRVGQLTEHVVRFFDEMDLDRAVLCGNSIGGQIALDFHAHFPERIEKLILCGSAGLFERNMTGGTKPRLCRDFIREQACEIFHDPIHVDDELVDDMYTMLSDRKYRRFVLRIAKASRDRCVMDELAKVKVPTLIVWGSNDKITPPFVAEQFNENISHAKLAYINDCGHAPPIEQPEKFTELLHAFLSDPSTDRHWGPVKPR